MSRRSKLTSDQRREAVGRRQRGEFLTDIARSYRVMHTAIARLMPNRAPKTMANAHRANNERAQQYAVELASVIGEIHSAGVTTLWGIAAALDERGIPTRRGAKWHPVQVAPVLARSR